MQQFPTQNSRLKFLKICFPQVKRQEVEKIMICVIKIQSKNMKRICNFSKRDIQFCK